VAVRAAAFGVVAAVLFGILLFRLWALQVLHSDDYVAQAVENDMRSIPVQAPRGRILDRDGVVLVGNAPGVEVQVNPARLPSRSTCNLWPPDERVECEARARAHADEEWPPCSQVPERAGCTVLKRLAAVLGRPARRVWRDYERGIATTPGQPVAIDAAVTKEQIAYVKERMQRFPGVEFQETYQRDYPLVQIGAHLWGNVGTISRAELRDDHFDHLRDSPNRVTAVVGHAGLEYVYDRFLRGIDGELQQSYDVSGEPVGPAYQRTAPTAGNDLRLTLDADLQRVAQDAIAYGIRVAHSDEDGVRANAGAIVAMDPRDGAIRAMASYPSFDPHVFVPPYRGYDRVFDPDNPLPPAFNRAMAGGYAPGSTFKPFVAAAAYRQNMLAPGSQLQCSPSYEYPGDTSETVFRNWTSKINTLMDLPTALEQSCDTFFYRLGAGFYPRGLQFQNELRRFGFGKVPSADLPGATAGRIPTPRWKAEAKAHELDVNAFATMWLPGDDINMSIGQGDMLVSPLQLANAYSTLANGGRAVTPHLGAAVEGPGSRERLPLPPPRDLSLDPNLLAEVREGLVRVTQSPNGTAYSVYNDFRPIVAGKTGTAEVFGKGDYAWFAGWAPADDPRLVVVALIEQGGHGGVAAAPAALRVFQSFFHPGQKLPAKIGQDESR
jgi:penicillin-binding protein 2